MQSNIFSYKPSFDVPAANFASSGGIPITGVISGGQTQISALTRKDLLGDMIHTGGLGYEPKVNYPFGFPRSIKPGGVVFDIPMVKIMATKDDNADKLKQFNLQTGILSSALEHAVPKQMFTNEQNPGEAISTVKALQKASAQGQRIYHITLVNQSTILPIFIIPTP